jgi:alanyl-tRNA synthetase
MSLSEAKDWGAVALFGETYDEEVRVVQVGGPWSRELCGGTHVRRSSQIGMLAITNETSVGSGARRLEALVGFDAVRQLSIDRALVSALTSSLKIPKEGLVDRVGQIVEDLKSAQRSLEQQASAALAERIPSIIENHSQTRGSLNAVAFAMEDSVSADQLRSLVSGVRDRLQAQPAIVIIGAEIASKAAVIIATTESARAMGIQANDVAQEVSQILGGGGGGKPDMAQGGGPELSKLNLAIEQAVASLER